MFYFAKVGVGTFAQNAQKIDTGTLLTVRSSDVGNSKVNSLLKTAFCRFGRRSSVLYMGPIFIN